MANRDGPLNKWFLYVHTSPSGKKYVGVTSQNPPEKRWGRYGQRYLIKNQKGEYNHPFMAHALLKYPNWDEWKHEILLMNETEEYVKRAEKCLIKSYKSNNPQFGYNLTLGGDGTSGYHISEEHKEKLRTMRLGKNLSDETKKKMSESLKGKFKGKNHPMYGTHRTDEQRQKTSDTLKEKYKNGWNSDRFNKRLSDEAKQKISCALMGEKNPNFGVAPSDESRKKMSESRKKFLSNKENHPNYNKYLSEETKKKISNSNSGVNNTSIKPVYCIEMDMIFYGAAHVKKMFGFDNSCITKCCKNPNKSCGKHPTTGQCLHWLYVSDAINNGFIMQTDVDKFIENLRYNNTKGE